MRPPQTRKRAAIIAIAILVGLISIAPPPALAQTDEIAELQEAIQRNAELLEEARALVRETNSVKARVALEAAEKLHESSEELLAFSAVRAGRTVREAREAILRTIAIARQEAKLEQGAHKAMERASQRLEKARTALDEYGGRDDGPPRKLVEEARVQLKRSRDNLQEHMFEVALRLAKASSDLSARALQLLKRNGVSPERVLREITRTDNALTRIEELNAASRPNIERLLKEARDLQQRAKRNARSDMLRLALEQTQRARGIALRVLKTAGASDLTDEESVTRAIRFTDEILERSFAHARKHDLDGAIPQLDDAARRQRGARATLEAGDLEDAMQLTLRAREIARNAVRGAKRPVDSDAVRTAMERTDEALNRLRAALAGSDNEQARALYERAAQRQAEAWDAFASRQPRKALALTKVAGDLAQKATRQLDDDDG